MKTSPEQQTRVQRITTEVYRPTREANTAALKAHLVTSKAEGLRKLGVGGTTPAEVLAKHKDVREAKRAMNRRTGKILLTSALITGAVVGLSTNKSGESAPTTATAALATAIGNAQAGKADLSYFTSPMVMNANTASGRQEYQAQNSLFLTYDGHEYLVSSSYGKPIDMANEPVDAIMGSIEMTEVSTPDGIPKSDIAQAHLNSDGQFIDVNSHQVVHLVESVPVVQ